ncbi:adenosylcobinamide-GDP ribazoletransferase [Thioalkalivibrio sp. ALE30]|uniref:adenosylcobinamide-GDP ribazoletransferase n=1 Tax=Thioalkalivibrio sp. ALE30 TaxID=1158181 RepID=UPI00035DFA82|nr:adenosylcobinamide-GDP ribazoletransferase [Thioalkalivibrio sp. ALE30]
MNPVMTPLWLAIQFLTRLPTPALEPRPEDLGRSVLTYPLVGLILGLIVVIVGIALSAIPGAPTLLVAALVLTFWVALTGALHLDGLADTVDAWVGGQRHPERARGIMKDPACGPMAVAALILVLLLKGTALVAVLESGAWIALLLAIVLGRVVPPVLFLTTPYVNPVGLGAEMAQHLPRRAAIGVVGATVLLSLILGLVSGLWGVIPALVAVGLLLWGAIHLLKGWLGGFTGDTVGATLELVETSVLVILVLTLGLH